MVHHRNSGNKLMRVVSLVVLLPFLCAFQQPTSPAEATGRSKPNPKVDAKRNTGVGGNWTGGSQNTGYVYVWVTFDLDQRAVPVSEGTIFWYDGVMTAVDVRNTMRDTWNGFGANKHTEIYDDGETGFDIVLKESGTASNGKLHAKNHLGANLEVGLGGLVVHKRPAENGLKLEKT